MEDCLFCRIIRGELPSQKVYEDEHVYAFRDISPEAPVHVLFVPRTHVASMAELGPEHEQAMGRLMVAAARVAAELGLDGGFRTIINTGRVGLQEVYHLHLHLLGGPDPLPPMLQH